MEGEDGVGRGDSRGGRGGGGGDRRVKAALAALLSLHSSGQHSVPQRRVKPYLSLVCRILTWSGRTHELQ